MRGGHLDGLDEGMRWRSGDPLEPDDGVVDDGDSVLGEGNPEA